MEINYAEKTNTSQLQVARPTTKYIPALDGLRAIAIGVVFLYHYGGGKQSAHGAVRLIGNVINFGWVGVSLFFVLSGFLITGILWDSFSENHWWKNFYIRRSLRIFPLYYVALFVVTAAVIFLKVPPRPFPGLLIYALYLQDFPSHLVRFFTDPLGSSFWLGHLWSLAVEEQFYLIWPALLFLFARKRIPAMRMILVLWALSFVYRLAIVHFTHSGDWALFSLPGRSGELLAGAYLALFTRGTSTDRARLEEAAPIVLGASFLAFFFLAFYVIHAGMSADESDRVMAGIGLAILSVASPCLLVVSMSNRTLSSILSISFLRWVGRISYGLYVYHFLFRRQFYALASLVAPHASTGLHMLLGAVIALIGTFAIATLSYYTLEKAFLRLKPKLSSSPS